MTTIRPLRHIRRFPRGPSDAHLVPPPSSKPFLVVIESEPDHLSALSNPKLHNLLAKEFNLRPLGSFDRPPPIKELLAFLKTQNLIGDLFTEHQTFDGTVRVIYTRKPTISSKLLANLTPPPTPAHALHHH